uniref:hypothetical protein n=1 Tax=Nonomuraea pusilla TaxID=46177 RepID=UPI0006E1CBDA|nr:hypothetical protein [Nonomuraea pusilla]
MAARYVGSLADFLLLGGGVVASALLLVVFSRDPRPGEYEVVLKERRPPVAALADFLSALAHRDFLWVFLGRALMILSYFMVLMFQLFILQDHIGTPSGVTPVEGVATLTFINVVAFGVYMAVDTALATLVPPNPENAARDLGVLNIANAGPQRARSGSFCGEWC